MIYPNSYCFLFSKEGSLSLKELEENTALQTVHFHMGRRERRRLKPQEQLGVAVTCDNLVYKKLLRLTDEAKYELTEEDRVKAELSAKAMEKGAGILENQFPSLSATARNTIAG